MENAPQLAEIPLASRIIAVCDAYDAMTHRSVYRNALDQSQALVELVRCSPHQFDPSVIEKLIELFNENPKFNEEAVTISISQRTALEMGGYIESFANSLAEGDVSKLRDVTKQLEATASSNNIESVVKATMKLESELSQDETDLTQLTELTDELMDLCRESRRVIVDHSEPDFALPPIETPTAESHED